MHSQQSGLGNTVKTLLNIISQERTILNVAQMMYRDNIQLVSYLHYSTDQVCREELTSGFPLLSLWQADTEAKQVGKILLVT